MQQHDAFDYFIEPQVMLRHILPFLHLADFRNLLEVSKEFAQILTTNEQQECFSWVVNVGQVDSLQLIKRYSEGNDEIKTLGSMIDGSRGVKISSYFTLSDNLNYEIVGKFLRKIVEKRKQVILEIPEGFDILNLELINKWCEGSIYLLKMNVSTNTKIDFFQSSERANIGNLIKKCGCKEWEITLVSNTNCNQVNLYVSYYLDANQSCEKISFRYVNIFFEFTFSKSSLELECIRLEGVTFIQRIMNITKMLSTVKRMELRDCYMVGLDCVILNNLEYLKMEKTDCYYPYNLENWEMPNLQTLICTKSRLPSIPTFFLKYQKLKELILDHQHISNIPMDLALKLKNLSYLSLQNNRLKSFHTIEYLLGVIPKINLKNNPFTDFLVLNENRQIEIGNADAIFKIEFSSPSYFHSGHFTGYESNIYKELRRAIVKNTFINIKNNKRHGKNIIFWNRTFLDVTANNPNIGIPTEITHFAIYLVDYLRKTNGGLSWVFFSVLNLSDGDVRIIKVSDMYYDNILADLPYIMSNWRHFSSLTPRIERLKQDY